MCGILGIFGYKDISNELLCGLTTLQHRGQDSAGVTIFNNNFRTKKGLGLVNNVFKEKNLEWLNGNYGIGHVRYATQGTIELSSAQPFSVNYPLGIAMVHNGNVINFSQLRKSIYENHHWLFESTNDLELILYTFASELANKNLKNLSVNDIFDSVSETQKKVQGAYSTIAIIANRGLLAFTDPYAIRPLVIGEKKTNEGTMYAIASESTCFDYLGYKLIGDVEPGEAVFIDKNGNLHCSICHSKGCAFCVFEYIYVAREDSIIHGRLVAGERVKMGRLLARKFKELGLEPDIVIDVPASAYFSASGLAEELGIPYRRGFAKNNHIGRSFISPSQEEREMMVKQKLNPIKAIIKGRKVAVVDDSIVRGTTSKHIVRLLKEAGAKKVYFVSASPPIRYPCIYGIDMSIKEELIASNNEVDEIAQKIGADALIYQSLDDLKTIYKDFPSCYACFSGEHPMEVSKEILEEIEKERLNSKGM